MTSTPLVAPMRKETGIISQWRRLGEHASNEALNNIHDRTWCHARVRKQPTTPLSKGDLALLMEYAPDINVRAWCRTLVLNDGIPK